MVWELRVAEPMLDMSFFRNPAFSTGTGGMILVFLSMYGVIFLVTQYFQLVHGYSPLSASLRTLPIAIIMIVVSPFTPRLSARFGAHRTVAFGMISVSIAFGLLAHARRAQPVRVHGRVLHPAHRRDRAHDVADDRVDHVGGAGPAGGRRLGDERRHP